METNAYMGNEFYTTMTTTGMSKEQKQDLISAWKKSLVRDVNENVQADVGSLGSDLESHIIQFLNGKEQDVKDAAARFGVENVHTFYDHLQYLLSCVDESFMPWQKDVTNDPYQLRSKLEALKLSTKTPDTRFQEIMNMVENVACEAKQKPTASKFTNKCTIPMARTQKEVLAYGGSDASESENEDEKVTYKNKVYKIRYGKQGPFIIVDGKHVYLDR